MRFKDLPRFNEIEKFCNNIYSHERTFIYEVHLLHAEQSNQYPFGFSSHLSLFSAYDFLRRNHKLEVRDDFFGNNFPFLVGFISTLVDEDMGRDIFFPTSQSTGVKHANTPMISILLENFNVLINTKFDMLVDLKLSYELPYQKIPNAINKHEYYVLCGHQSYCKVSTYSELVDRISIAKIMSF